jgi:hypothetical protein
MAIVGAIGAAVSAIGSVAQGMAASKEAQYQAQVARNNAIIARKNAEYTLEAGDREESAYRMKGDLIRAAIKARAGASGADVNTGSPIEVQAGAALVQELDALTIRNNARREAYNQQVQATNFEAQAGLNELQGDNAMTAGILGGISSLAGGLASVSPKWNSWRSPTPYTPATYPGASISVPTTGPGAGLSSPTVPSVKPAPGAGMSSPFVPSIAPRAGPGAGPAYR